MPGGGCALLRCLPSLDSISTTNDDQKTGKFAYTVSSLILVGKLHD